MKINHFLAFVALITTILLPKSTDAQAIKIHEGMAFKTGVCEPSISVDPTNKNNIYAGSILSNFYQSTNGGLTWTTSEITSPHGVYGDPCIITDYSGRTYYFHLSDPKGTNWQSDSILDRMVCQSKDGPNDRFNEGSFTQINGKKHDKEWAAVHPSNGTIGLSWTQFDSYGTTDPSCTSTILYSESVDQGDTWSSPAIISERKGDCVDDDKTAEGAVPAFGIKNARYVGWALDRKIFFNRSLDGLVWEEFEVADQKAGWTQSYNGFSRCNGMPVTVVDQCSSSPFYGRIYMCWGDQSEQTGGEIYISYSDNGGENWSRPFAVSNQGGSSDQFLPWLTIDPTSGFLYAVYYDRRNTTKPTETNTYLAISKDGGSNWTEQQINEVPFFPSNDVFMGDYNHISAYGGVVRPIWTELNDSKKSVWTYLYNETF